MLWVLLFLGCCYFGSVVILGVWFFNKKGVVIVRVLLFLGCCHFDCFYVIEKVFLCLRVLLC